jgi:hypothetical protein
VTNVVDLPKRERLIWICGHCGCSSFYLYSDQTCECAGCGHVSDGGEWVTPIEDKTKSPEKDNAGSISVVAIGSVQFAKARALKAINSRTNEIALVGAWFEDGSSNSWCGAETKDQQELVVRKLRELADHIENKPVEAAAECEND